MKVHQFVGLLLLHVAASWTSDLSIINRGDPAFQTFMANLIEQFQELAANHGRRQFAVVVMVSQQELAGWNVNYQPSDAFGYPLIDWYRTLSPPNPNEYGNFIVAVPSHIGEHSEYQIMPHLGQLLQRFRMTHDNQNPAAIILYSRICPCLDCTGNIIQSFHELNLPPQVEQSVIYTTDGIPGVDPDYSWMQFTAFAITFFRFAVTRGQCGPRQIELGLDELQEVNDCRPLQSYLLDQFGESVECCVSSTKSQRATADLINRLMASCSLELDKLDICLERTVKVKLGSYCSCANGVVTAARLSQYMKNVMQSSTNNLDLHYVSKPLDPSNPTLIMDPITSRDQLLSYDKTVTYSCKDNRQRGLMCSFLKSNYLTAGRSICKQDSPCDYHGKSYSWCYLEAGSWEYCCTENCRPDGWCNSGSTYQYCTGDIGYVTAGNTVCKTNSPCGLHGYSYSWCYTDYGWEYCCTDECGYQKKGYQWCKAGNTWEYCGRYDNGQGLSNVKKADCLPNHPCGKHAQYTYKYWCYTDSKKNWDYCCIPGCPCSTYSYSYYWCYTGENKNRWDRCMHV